MIKTDTTDNAANQIKTLRQVENSEVSQICAVSKYIRTVMISAEIPIGSRKKDTKNTSIIIRASPHASQKFGSKNQ